jgi:hypothetical protein
MFAEQVGLQMLPASGLECGAGEGIHDVDRYRNIFLFLTLRTTLFKPGLLRLLEHGHEAFPPVRGNEESSLRQGETDDYSPSPKSSTSNTKMAAITYLCNAEF